MPPKKLKEEEAARLLEEQRLKEEEERQRLEELKKYQSTTIQTGLELPITVFYMEQVHNHAEPIKFTIEYLKQILEMNNCLDKFRPIDIQLLADQVINDYVFAVITMQLNGLPAQVLINILFFIYTNNNVKFAESLRTKPQTNKKTITTDQTLFNKLITKHSNENDGGIKLYTAIQLPPILRYINIGYFAHHALILHANQNEQRPLELQLDLQIDTPIPFPTLDDAVYKPSQMDTEHSLRPEEDEQQEEQEEPPHEPTDEELLDPAIVLAIQQKLEEARLELEEQLDKRRVELEEKITTLATQKKGGKK